MAISTAVDASAVARVVGIKTIFKDLRAGNILSLPQRIAVVGQGSTAAVYATTKRQVTSAQEVGSLYGFGSPVHLAALQLFPATGDGVGTIPVTIYPLVDDGSGVVSDGTILPGGSPTVAASYVVRVNGVESEPFVISVGDVVATITAAITTAINAVIGMPIIAVDGTTDVDFTSKWKGTSANDIFVEVLGSTTAGNTFGITQPTGGLVNPDVDDALNQVGDVWETLFLNCMEFDDTGTLDKFDVFGESRWGSLTRKPMIALHGNTVVDEIAATAVSDVRPTDRTNGFVPAPGSVNLPLAIAARAIARIAVRANNNPAYDYGSLDLTGIIPGTDAEQWTFVERDVAIKRGGGSTQLKDGVVNLSDTVTFYKPLGEPVPAYRYVVDIVKLQNILFNLDLIFNSPQWDGAPLIPDNQPTINPDAKQPKMAKAEIGVLIDSLGLNALISDPATAKQNVLVEIDAGNPKRLNICLTIQLSGNTNIISVDLKFGFFFGQPSI